MPKAFSISVCIFVLPFILCLKGWCGRGQILISSLLIARSLVLITDNCIRTIVYFWIFYLFGDCYSVLKVVILMTRVAVGCNNIRNNIGNNVTDVTLISYNRVWRLRAGVFP